MSAPRCKLKFRIGLSEFTKEMEIIFKNLLTNIVSSDKLTKVG